MEGSWKSRWALKGPTHRLTRTHLGLRQKVSSSGGTRNKQGNTELCGFGVRAGGTAAIVPSSGPPPMQPTVWHHLDFVEIPYRWPILKLNYWPGEIGSLHCYSLSTCPTQPENFPWQTHCLATSPTLHFAQGAIWEQSIVLGLCVPKRNTFGGRQPAPVELQYLLNKSQVSTGQRWAAIGPNVILEFASGHRVTSGSVLASWNPMALARWLPEILPPPPGSILDFARSIFWCFFLYRFQNWQVNKISAT